MPRSIPFTLLIAASIVAAMSTRASFDRCSGGSTSIEPLWPEGDGDVLVIAADTLAGSVSPLLDDLAGRGFRCAHTRLSLILRDFGGMGIEADRAIRSAIERACETFHTRPLAVILVGTASEDTPENDLLPTPHIRYEHELQGWYDDTFAEDASYGDLRGSPDLAPELIVGRIPVRTGEELAAYVAKIRAYRQEPGLPSILFAVGDASINRANDDRRRAAESLIDVARREAGLSVDAQFASAYMPLALEANRVRALEDLRGRLARGFGLLEIFGNNVGPTDLVHMLEAPPGPERPWLVPEEMPTEGKLPIAIFHTCLNGAFDEDAPFPGYDSPSETWVREPLRGAAAVLAQSHVTTFFDDVEIAGQVLRRIGRRDGATLGAIQAGIRASLLAEATRGSRSESSVRMGNLMGDPLLVPRLGIDPIRLDGTFEAGGTWPLQNSIAYENGWTCGGFDERCAVARIVRGGLHDGACGEGFEGPVQPIAGSRMLRIAGTHAVGEGVRGAAWRIFSCDVRIDLGSVLSYWVRQEVDPRNRGRLSCDAVTASGRVLSRELIDNAGLPADPARYGYSLGAWHRIAVPLDRWVGERVSAIYVRYEDPERPTNAEPDRDASCDRRRGSRTSPAREPESRGGAFRGYIDEVRITPGPPSPRLDLDLEEDEDGDGRPDAWTAPWPANHENEPARGIVVRVEGMTELWLTPDRGLPAGASRLLGPSSNGDPVLRLKMETRGTGSLRLAIVDPEGGGPFDTMTFAPGGAEWIPRDVSLFVPADRTALFEMRPSGGAVGIREIRVVDGTTGPETTRAEAALAVAPNPASAGFTISGGGFGDPIAGCEIFDTTGRRIAVRRIEGSDQTRPIYWEPSDATGRRLPAGSYFLRVTTRGGTRSRSIRIVR